MISAIPDLGNTLILFLFILILCGILGVQLFAGSFEYKCRLTSKPVDGYWVADPNVDYLCGVKECPSGFF